MDDGSRLHGTGMINLATGAPYITNDNRVIQAEQQQAQQPQPPPKSAPTAPAAKPLSQRLREFEISRFDKGAVSPSRFGANFVSIKIFFENESSAEFKMWLQAAGANTFNVSGQASHFTLGGNLVDASPYQTLGDLTLTDRNSKETAHIFYRAYKATLRFRKNATRPIVPGSIFDRELHALSDNTFGWVDNWAVVGGRAVYLVDIVKVVAPGQSTVSDPVPFAFKGESLQTGDQQYQAQTTGTDATVTLVGNGEVGDYKMYSLVLKDPSSTDTYQVMVDVNIDKGNKAIPAVISNPSLEIPTGVDAEDEDPVPAPDSSNSPQENQPPAINAHATVQSVVNGKAYLRIDTSTPRAARMVHDYYMNRQLTGVVKTIENFKGKDRATLESYFRYANPFRPMFESIARAYDVATSFAFLPVNESRYFEDGKYNGDQWGDKEKGHWLALGPFQFHADTAQDTGVNIGGRDDRPYFAPSACGAARYMAVLADEFDGPGMDTTIGLIGFNQGGTGAKILARNFGYTYAEMTEKYSAIPAAVRTYVDKMLAVFFIAADLPTFGFSVPANAAKTLPGGQNWIVPPGGIRNPTCQQTVASFIK